MAVDKSPPKSQVFVRVMRTCTLAGTSAMSCNRLRGDERDHVGLRLAVGRSASPARRIASRLAVGRRPTGWEMDHNLAKVGVVGSNPIARSNKSQSLSGFGLTETVA